MSNSRIPPTEITGFWGFFIKHAMRRMLGEVPEPLAVMWHNPAVLMSAFRFGRKAEKWRHLDAGLKSLAHIAVASQVGCALCLDLGYFKAQNAGLDMRKASEVPRWRASDAFTALERDVLDYAEAMTSTPPQVTDQLSARLLEQLGAPALVELTAWVAFANFATRCNATLGFESQGLSQVCELRPAVPEQLRSTLS